MPETQLPEHIALHVDEEISIALPGVGISGYVWRLEQTGDSGIAAAALRRESVEITGASVGRAAPETLVIRGENPGTLTLKLLLQRPWERDSTPLQRHLVEIRVT